MNVLVCIKQVPASSNVKVDPETGVLKRNSNDAKMNPYDLYALECALELVERCGGTVEVITMGPPSAGAVIEEAICMGATNGCVLSDRKFAGADVLATAYTLSQGIRSMGKFDVIFCGKQTTDGDTAQVGPETAEFMNIPHIAGVKKIEKVRGGNITVVAKQGQYLVTQTVSMPCMICTESDINTPRLPSYKRQKAMSADKSEIQIKTFESFLDKDESHYGLAGSATQVEKIFPPDVNTEKQFIEGNSEEQTEQLLKLLNTKKFI